MVDTVPLRLGARVCFEDRWQGRVTSFDVAEDWEVLNFTVSTGVLFFGKSLKLPYSAVARWDEGAVYLNVVSFHAFAREVPPVAAPARPIDQKTPIAHGGMRVAGVIIRPSDRRVTELLLARGVGNTLRVPVGQVAFDGKALTLGARSDGLDQFAADSELEDRIHESITDDNGVTPDDKRSLTIRVESGVAILGGNVRMRPTKHRVESIVTALAGIVRVQNEISDDISLETDIGLALDRAGLFRHSEVYARSSLGIATLYGYAPNSSAVDDIVREVARVPGVQRVASEIEVRPPGALLRAVS